MELPLRELPVLMVDCQTTGANPQRGALLELAWATSNATAPTLESCAIQVRLVKLPNQARIPPAIARLTGISQGELDNKAMGRRAVANELFGSLPEKGSDVPAGPRTKAAIQAQTWTVAHYARFEDLFLKHLFGEVVGRSTYPLRFICTHEIAKRLLPHLPRRGLHALAGYFGSPLSEHKRALEHLQATAVVWHGLVHLLSEEHGIQNLTDLLSWLERPAPKRGSRFSFPLPRERRLALDDTPGVYRFLSANRDILYIGKATSLHTRVNSYFRKRKASDRLLELVSQTQDLEVTETATSLEAALLEVDEIKRHNPPYNRALKDQGRQLWYFTHDFKSASWQPGAKYPHGPLPHEEAGKQLWCLCKTLNSPTAQWPSETDLRTSLGLEHAKMKRGALHKALEILGNEWGTCSTAPLTTQFLLRQGHLQWHRHLAEIRARDTRKPEGAEGAEPENSAKSSSDPQPLNAQEVHDIIAAIPMMIAHRLRRGRWILRLSNSGLWWTRPEEKGSAGRTIVVRDGIIRARADTGSLAESREIADGVALAEGQASRGAVRTDIEPPGLTAFASYERMRVFNSEIRRLVQQGRDLRVWMDPDRLLDSRHVGRILPWV